MSDKIKIKIEDGAEMTVTIIRKPEPNSSSRIRRRFENTSTPVIVHCLSESEYNKILSAEIELQEK